MNNQNNNGCGCNCNPHPAPECPVDIDMSVCDKNINMLPMLQTYTTKVLKPNVDICCGKKNILTQEMLSCENYKYVIKWDFDLNGKTITVPKNCILEFDGGTLKNGTIVGQDTVFINVGDVEIWGEGLTREGTWKENSGGGGGHEEDRPYNPSEFVGMGKKYLEKNIVDDKNILTQGMINEANTIYVIQYDYVLAADIDIPANCVLEFDGGSICGDGVGKDTITLNNTTIISNGMCLKDIVLAGTLNNEEVLLVWFNYDTFSVLQNVITYCSANSKNLNLCDKNITVSEQIAINRAVDTFNEYFTIKNGTITCNINNILTTTRCEYLKFKNVKFLNGINAENHIIGSWLFLRLRFENCTFENVGLLKIDEQYIQSCYINNCLINNLDYNFVEAPTCYDIHFTGNSVEHLATESYVYNCVLFEIARINNLSISNNLIESVAKVVSYTYQNGLSIVNNYFEGLSDCIVMQYGNPAGSVGHGFTFIGNSCKGSQNPAYTPSNRYAYIYLWWESEFVIIGNEFAEAPNIVPVTTSTTGLAHGTLDLPSPSADSGYRGRTTNVSIKATLDGNETDLRSAAGVSGHYMPKFVDHNRWESGGTIYPNVGGYLNRGMITQLVGAERENLFEFTSLNPGRPSYFPVKYLKLYSPYTGAYSDGWARQATILDENYDANFYDEDFKTSGSNGFTEYHNGTMRFKPERGLEMFCKVSDAFIKWFQIGFGFFGVVRTEEEVNELKGNGIGYVLTTAFNLTEGLLIQFNPSTFVGNDTDKNKLKIQILASFDFSNIYIRMYKWNSDEWLAWKSLSLNNL